VFTLRPFPCECAPPLARGQGSLARSPMPIIRLELGALLSSLALDVRLMTAPPSAPSTTTTSSPIGPPAAGLRGAPLDGRLLTTLPTASPRSSRYDPGLCHVFSFF